MRSELYAHANNRHMLPYPSIRSTISIYYPHQAPARSTKQAYPDPGADMDAEFTDGANENYDESNSASGPENPDMAGYSEALNRFEHLMSVRNTAVELHKANKESSLQPTGSPETARDGCVETSRRMMADLDISSSGTRRKRGKYDQNDSIGDDENVLQDILSAQTFTTEFGHIAIPSADKIHQVLSTDIFPYYPAPRELFAREFWLAAAVIDCADYDTTAAMLESGAIQYAIKSCRSQPTHEVRVLLITLLRLAASCYTHAHYLLSVQQDIFAFLLDCLKVRRAQPSLMDSVVRWSQLSDSRAYSSYLAISFAAHTRPTAIQFETMTAEEKWTYENHVQIVWHEHDAIFQNSRTYTKHLPKYLAPYYDTFYLNDFAAEIFVDLAPRGFFNTFTTNVIETKWDRCFNIYLENAPFNITTVKLYRSLHQSPLTVAAHLALPFAIYKECYAYLSWGLRSILDAEYYRNPANAESWNRPRTKVPLEFIIACADTLRTFLEYPSIGTSTTLRQMRAFLRRPVVVHQLLRFVLAMPNVVDEKRDASLDLLYSAVWSLIHALSYTFPFMFGTLVDFACDSAIPDCLGVQAAMYVATAVSFARVPLKRSEIVGVYERLLHDLKRRNAEPYLVRRRRQELVFRMTVILCPTYFGAGSQQKPREQAGSPDYLGSLGSSYNVSGMSSVSQCFIPYRFLPEEEEN